MIAENVPPKTIKIDVAIKSARNDPPSKKKAPKMENKPTSNPIIVPALLIICNQRSILEMN